MLNVGLMGAVAIPPRSAAMATLNRLSLGCRASFPSGCLVNTSSLTTTPPYLPKRLLQSATMPFSRQSHPFFQPSSQRSIRSLLLQTRPFSATCIARTQPSPSPTKTASPTPPPAPPKQPLSEDILTIPNLLTMLRLALTPYIGYLVVTHHFVPACTLLFVASITDVLDGWIARKTGKYTVFGSIADPAADKALVTTMVISLAMCGLLPWSIASIILGRDVALVISAFVIRYRTLQPPKTWSRYFNPKLPSATVTPTTISKYNTFLQLVLVGLLTLYPILFPNQRSPSLSFSPLEEPTVAGSRAESHTLGETHDSLSHARVVSAQAKSWVDCAITGLMWIVGATTVWSGVGYLGGAGTAKVLATRASQVRKSLTKPPSSSV